MLSIFNKFLSRMRSTHKIFGEKKILILILEHLNGKDLFQIFQVSYFFRTVMQSVPILEITMLKYTIKKSNKSIGKLRKSKENKTHFKNVQQVPFNYSHYASKFLKTCEVRKRSKESPIIQNLEEQKTPNFSEEKWVNFTRHFHEYAKNNGLKILKKADFDDEMQWKDYKLKYITFYHNYVDHIRREREKLGGLRNSRVSLRSYTSFISSLNSSTERSNSCRIPEPSSTS